jgi:hypothetical protein
MTYAEKLKDIRWIDFRQEFIKARRRDESYKDECDACGEDTCGPLHVHHRRYIHGREPWEYDYCDLRLLCESCHDLIHDTEQFARAFVLALPPHVMPEMRQMLDELNECNEPGLIKIAFAHAKNALRNVLYKKEADSTAGVGLIKTIAELEEEYRAAVRKEENNG